MVFGYTCISIIIWTGICSIFAYGSIVALWFKSYLLVRLNPGKLQYLWNLIFTKYRIILKWWKSTKASSFYHCLYMCISFYSGSFSTNKSKLIWLFVLILMTIYILGVKCPRVNIKIGIGIHNIPPCLSRVGHHSIHFNKRYRVGQLLIASTHQTSIQIDLGSHS